MCFRGTCCEAVNQAEFTQDRIQWWASYSIKTDLLTNRINTNCSQKTLLLEVLYHYTSSRLAMTFREAFTYP